MFLHVLRRSIDIVSARPRKALLIFTTKGWKAFFGLRKERVIKTDSTSIAMRKLELQMKIVAFESDGWTHQEGLSVRKYNSYEQYVNHQRDKLDSLDGQAFANPEKAINMFRRRLWTCAVMVKCD
jgi:hypothetical protein